MYLAHDHALERLVAIKEYMPGQLAQRGQNSQVSVRSGSMRETFELGLRSFVNEARLLARFDHRSLLKVFRFWEANNTAYMVVPYLQGQTLLQWREASGVAPAGDWLMAKLHALLEALEVLHAERVYHRDIAPDNIFLPLDGGDPILLDFGAARRALSDTTQSFTAILKPSYAPLEQYDGASSLRQGPWTDLYALGAVVYHLLTGHPPPAATRRALADDYEPLRPERFPEQPERLLQAANWALALRPGDRPQSVAEWRQGLAGEREMPAPPPPESAGLTALAKAAQAAEPTQMLPMEPTVLVPRTRPMETVSPGAVPTVPLSGAATPSPAARAAPAAASQPPWLLFGLLVAVALLAAFWWVLKSQGGPPAAVDMPAAPASAVSSAASEAPPVPLGPGEVFVEPAPAGVPAASAPLGRAPPPPAGRLPPGRLLPPGLPPPGRPPGPRAGRSPYGEEPRSPGPRLPERSP